MDQDAHPPLTTKQRIALLQSNSSSPSSSSSTPTSRPNTSTPALPPSSTHTLTSPPATRSLSHPTQANTSTPSTSSSASTPPNSPPTPVSQRLARYQNLSSDGGSSLGSSAAAPATVTTATASRSPHSTRVPLPGLTARGDGSAGAEASLAKQLVASPARSRAGSVASTKEISGGGVEEKAEKPSIRPTFASSRSPVPPRSTNASPQPSWVKRAASPLPSAERGLTSSSSSSSIASLPVPATQPAPSPALPPRRAATLDPLSATVPAATTLPLAPSAPTLPPRPSAAPSPAPAQSSSPAPPPLPRRAPTLPASNSSATPTPSAPPLRPVLHPTPASHDPLTSPAASTTPSSLLHSPPPPPLPSKPKPPRPSRVTSNASFSPPSLNGGGETKKRPMDPRAKRRYERVFEMCCSGEEGKERVEGAVVREVWKKSRLEEDDLRRIWVDVSSKPPFPPSTSLDRDGFLAGMWQIDELLRRHNLQHP